MKSFLYDMVNFPLSPFREAGSLIFVSGQIGQQNGKLISDSVEEQTVQAVANVVAILNQNNLSLKNVVDVTAFLVDQNDYDAFNVVYAKEFSEPYPARTTVTVKSLPLGARIELKAVAAKNII